jgi:cyclopropane fatty-acyl-phospholipid synthase-like methyltransferase
MGYKEEQYNVLTEQYDESKNFFGPVTSFIWQNDPKRVGIVLSRYKFISKMLAGKHSVLEIGCGDGFNSELVASEVGALTCTDFDPLFVKDAQRLRAHRSNMEFQVFNFIDGNYPKKMDAIYSVDVFEHISKEYEDIFTANIHASLEEHGVYIVGSPSLESQKYASEESRKGHINCKSGLELKAFLEKYFRNVFLFSMNDEVIHTGYYPMAHFLFAVCVK